MVKQENDDIHRRYMPVHDHNILNAFTGKLVRQRQSENTSANDDNSVAWAYHDHVLIAFSIVEMLPDAHLR
jgi:hypothetical protein